VPEACTPPTEGFVFSTGAIWYPTILIAQNKGSSFSSSFLQAEKKRVMKFSWKQFTTMERQSKQGLQKTLISQPRIFHLHRSRYSMMILN
jgi:uncharacterized protein YbaA (DUF1428 family)